MIVLQEILINREKNEFNSREFFLGHFDLSHRNYGIRI